MSSDVQRVVEALRWSAPFALAAVFDEFAHCVEASVCGASVLAEYGIKARAVPCAIIGRALDRSFSVGLTERETYELMDKHGVTRPQQVVNELREQNNPVHMIIEATDHGERTLVDLTYAQLRKLGVSSHATWASTGDGWPVFEGEGWALTYMEPPRARLGAARELINTAVRCTGSGLLLDALHTLTATALLCDGDATYFLEQLLVTQPALFERTTKMVETA